MKAFQARFVHGLSIADKKRPPTVMIGGSYGLKSGDLVPIFRWRECEGVEPSLVGQVLAGLHALLVDYLQLFVGEPAHRRDLLAPSVGNLVIYDLMGSVTTIPYLGSVMAKNARGKKGYNGRSFQWLPNLGLLD